MSPRGGRHIAAAMLLIGAGTVAAVSPRGVAADSWAERWLTGPRAEAQLQAPAASRRREAARILGREGASGPAVDALVEALPDEQDPTVRRAIIRALARRGDPRATDALIEALESGPAQNRAAVLDALGALGTDGANEALLGALDRDAMEGPAHDALVRMGGPALPPLVESLDDPDLAPPAARVLGAIGHHAAVPHLLARLDAEAAEVRAALVRALGAIGDSRAADAVAARVDDPSARVVREVLRTLRRIGARRHAEAVRTRAVEGPLRQRRAGMRALMALDPKAGARVLEQAVEGEDAAGADAALEVALGSTHPATVPLLRGLLRDGSRVGAAASTLANIEDGQGLEVLVAHAQRPDPPGAVGRALAVGLRRWHDVLAPRRQDRARVALERVLENAPKPRKLALAALARQPGVGGVLAESLGAERALVRATAALGLQWLGASRYGPAVAAAAVDEPDGEPFRRMASAAAALGTGIRPAQLDRRIANAAVAPEALIAGAAALDRIDPRARRAFRRRLRRALRAAEARVRAGAARALARADDREAWRPLVARLDDEAVEVRRSVARALEALGVPEARADLEARIRIETHTRVRRALEDAVAACRRGRGTPFPMHGRHVLRVRVIAARKRTPVGVPVDVVLPDGRWLRMRTLASGELWVPDLPAGDADVRVRVSP